ncbi:hypothetical protein CYLTODRAFT_474834 [Cylindrobasidium torrendii FP15055 ss-10]|uniref:Uncharacterized protein n=1 Tax=Cylindrobasidium torrendii FP15055 ss-10 TaxID=1314674 RepID=A0A0D7AYI4_9AGAR|nr:hypothetical protein CYLTODRAFT_474834 [Cylindrobasidium torrendii FP15055 ss-10]
MLVGFWEMRSVVKPFLDRTSHGLVKYILSEEEWDAVKDLVNALQVLKDATVYFSSNDPTLASIIPAMDRIDEVFATAAVQ